MVLGLPLTSSVLKTVVNLWKPARASLQNAWRCFLHWVWVWPTVLLSSDFPFTLLKARSLSSCCSSTAFTQMSSQLWANCPHICKAILTAIVSVLCPVAECEGQSLQGSQILSHICAAFGTHDFYAFFVTFFLLCLSSFPSAWNCGRAATVIK